ncbi:SMP-30/gluconolactonase/LRE family protein [Salirhabdus salicampi]|uniref:SMP-30/gluconolactonase/LRE family protein n=1 Tax=Salirhabdus salicampi TaxID=476102 RepID=UPI0020C1E49E|nr:SMP-30/gluconolactonase/LRE family protein [Salirhabdus salicampi]MCP8616343.1 SMP-30/gluconolactonase/LRE family protein [Salirhabdus salicampi]
MSLRKKGSLFIGISTLTLLLTLYLTLWPVPIEPVYWDAPQSNGYTSPHNVNYILADMKFIELNNYNKPEHIVYRDNWLYAAMKGGIIIRVRPDGTESEVVVNTGGRPLGFDFDSKGALLIADPLYGDHGGLLKVTDVDGGGEIKLLTDSAEGYPIHFADAVVVSKSGMIYFTDASLIKAKEIGDVGKAGELDILANSSTGRVLEYNPKTQQTRILMNNLSFANGIALTEDEQYLLINETGKYRVWKLDVTAENISALEPNKSAQIIIDNLPGLPDNIMKGNVGRYWIGLVYPRNDFLDYSANKPWLRSIAMRLPNFLLPKGNGYTHVISINESGDIVADLQDPNSTYTHITGATESDDKLFFHHLNNTTTIGWINLHQQKYLEYEPKLSKYLNSEIPVQ